MILLKKINSPVCSHETRLNWFPDKCKVSIGIKALPSDDILAQKCIHELLYFFLLIYINIFKQKKEDYLIQALIFQDHLIATINVKHTALPIPIQEDAKQCNNKLNPSMDIFWSST